jgi:hypothetical protein
MLCKAWADRGLVYRVSQKEMSIFWEVVVLVIVSKKVYMYIYLIPNCFRDIAISCHRQLKEHQDAPRQATSHVLTRVAKCTDVDGGILEDVLYQANCINFAT